MNISILVPAHNEAKNIQRLLTSILNQDLPRDRITEIVVVASGCTDDTAERAREVARGRPGIHVVVQERRGGKVAAINEYLRVRDQRADVAVSCSADIRLARDVLARICRCIEENPNVGMVGVHPVPDNDTSTDMGRVVHVLWELHHRIALETPKMGELVAFRAPLVNHVNELSIVDEASVEDIIQSKGYDLAYLPEAIVTNHGPEELREYFEQRRRIARGHYWLSFAFGYDVSTLSKSSIISKTLQLAREQKGPWRRAIATAIAIEVAARAAGFFDARIIGGRHRTWTPLHSTKNLGVDRSSLAAPPLSQRGDRDHDRATNGERS